MEIKGKFELSLPSGKMVRCNIGYDGHVSSIVSDADYLGLMDETMAYFSDKLEALEAMKAAEYIETEEEQ